MTRLAGRANPDARVDADGVRLPSTKYARRAVPRRDGRAARARPPPNVSVPFAADPTPLREFLWGETGERVVPQRVVARGREKGGQRKRSAFQMGAALLPPRPPSSSGLAVGFADLASLVRSAVTSDRTVLDMLPHRGAAAIPAAGVVDSGSLDRVLSARERGAFARPPGPRLAPRPRRESAAKGLAVVTAINVALLWAGANAPTEPR